mmetsp:Transcript_63954/g.101429  ORF Transcript_63954/g.101429 Transcript_63954/m.101429 type:complete len:141 (-) Transcript_63954:1-423(-)
MAIESDAQRAAGIVAQFKLFDMNADGCIDREEFETVLKVLAPEVWTPEKITELLRNADKNGDGTIDIEEFVGWAFEGTIDTKEFKDALQELEEPSTVWARCYRDSLEQEAARAQRKAARRKKKAEEAAWQNWGNGEDGNT